MSADTNGEQAKVEINWHINELEGKLGLTPGFFRKLIEEPDDWSYIIKAHTFFEAAVAQFVVACLDARIGRVIARLNLNGRGGKFALACALELVAAGTPRFAERLSHIRNSFAHDVRSSGMSLRAYLDELDRPGIEKAAGDLLSPFSFIGIAEPKGYELLRQRARPIVHFGLLATISDMYFRANPATRERDGSRGGHDDALTHAFLQLLGAALIEPLQVETQDSDTRDT